MSDAEEALAFQLKAVGIPFEREVRFAAPRKWRADFVVPQGCIVNGDPLVRVVREGCPEHRPLLIEVDGGTWVSGRHTTGKGFEADCEKLNAATLAHYRVLRVTPSMVDDGRALALIEKAVGL